MKTIQEQAKEFIGGIAAANNVPDCINELLVECYCIAALEVRKRLTSWHDANTNKPPIGEAVLLKLAVPDGHIYCVGDRLDADRYVLPAHCAFREVIAWREIHE